MGASLQKMPPAKVMKFSKYTSYIKLDDCRFLLFNAFTRTFVTITDKNLDINNIQPEDIKSKSSQLFTNLVEAGMLVEDALDELSVLKRLIIDYDNNSSEYILHINPTLDCNFNCWYCYENHIPKSRMSQETLRSVKIYISNILDNKQIRTLELGFFGGEPLLYFNGIAKEIILHANDVCFRNNQTLNIHFTSNGSLISEEQIKFLSKFSCGFQITIDGDKPSHDKTRFYRNGIGSYDIIIRNILRLINAGINVIVRVNYTNENIDGITSILDSLKNIPESQKEHIKFDFQKVWQDDKNNLTEDKIRMIRNLFSHQGFIVLKNYLHQHIGQSCYGDKVNHVLINYQGDLFGCTARDFTNHNRLGYLDNHGEAHYDSEKMRIRKMAKLGKSICCNCRIAPICGGGCSQKCYESINSDGCNMGYTEDDIDNKILDIFEAEIMSEAR